MEKNNSTQKILVGGGAGFIGSVLVPELIKLGHQVDVIDLCWFGNYLPESVKVIKKDLFDCTKEDLQGYDQFIFLAGLSNDPMADHNPAKNFVLNGALPSYLAYLAKQAKVKRFIYASSCSVYGFAFDHLFTEEDPAVSDYPYGISKLQGEKGVMQLADENFSAIALRQGTVCGFSPRMRMDLIVNTMCKNAITLGKITVNNPDIWRPIYDIKDCIQGFVKSVEAPISVSGVFNIASGNYTVGEVAEVVKKEIEELANKKVDIEINNIPDKRSYRASLEKAEKVLGFKPSGSVPNIVKDLYAHLKDLGDLEQEKYYNIRVFKNINL